MVSSMGGAFGVSVGMIVTDVVGGEMGKIGEVTVSVATDNVTMEVNAVVTLNSSTKLRSIDRVIRTEDEIHRS